MKVIQKRAGQKIQRALANTGNFASISKTAKSAAAQSNRNGSVSDYKFEDDLINSIARASIQGNYQTSMKIPRTRLRRVERLLQQKKYVGLLTSDAKKQSYVLNVFWYGKRYINSHRGRADEKETDMLSEIIQTFREPYNALKPQCDYEICGVVTYHKSDIIDKLKEASQSGDPNAVDAVWGDLAKELYDYFRTLP